MEQGACDICCDISQGWGRAWAGFSRVSPDSVAPPSTAVESTGTAKAEAESRAEALRIEGEGSVLQAKLKAEALAIETVSGGRYLWADVALGSGRGTIMPILEYEQDARY